MYGLCHDVVMQMVSGLENQGYVVYMDNFYSSPVLFIDLHRLRFGAVGTLDPTRRGCPGNLSAQGKKMLRKAYERGYGVWIRDGTIVFNVWKDTKVVCTASTIHTGNASHQVKRKVKKTGGGYQEVLVPSLMQYMTTTTTWVELIYLINFFNITKREDKLINTGKHFSTIVLISP